jgi:hypothetical protein
VLRSFGQAVLLTFSPCFIHSFVQHILITSQRTLLKPPPLKRPRHPSSPVKQEVDRGTSAQKEAMLELDPFPLQDYLLETQDISPGPFLLARSGVWIRIVFGFSYIITLNKMNYKIPGLIH